MQSITIAHRSIQTARNRALLDDLKERHGLRNPSQALLQLIGEKGAHAQHNFLEMAKARLAGRAFAKLVTGLAATSEGRGTPPR